MPCLAGHGCRELLRFSSIIGQAVKTCKQTGDNGVTKVEKGELVLLDNPNYPGLIHSYPHLKGVRMNDTDTKAQLPVHLIPGASEYAKIKTNIPVKIGTPGQPIAELTRFGWTIMPPGKECFNVTNMLLAQTSRIEYEELCRQDVLGLEDKVANDQSGVYDEFKETIQTFS